MFLILLLSAAVGGDDAEPTFRMTLAETQTAVFRIGATFGAQGRVSIPFGSADEGTVIVGGNTITIVNHIDYLELFDPGWGVTLEADLMFRPPRPPPDAPPWAQSPDMGGYLAFEWDRFGGSATRDNAGTEVRPESLNVTSVFGGFKAAGTVEGNLFGDVRLGFGAVHYPSLDATFRPASGPALRGELFAESWEFAMEIRMHFGWKLGPVGLVFGMGGRLFAPPERGANSQLDSGAFFTLDFELGAEIGF